MNRLIFPVALACGVSILIASSATAAPIKNLHAPRASGAWAGELIAPVIVRAAPNPGARKIDRLSAIGPIGGDETAMLITGSKRVKGVQWVRLLVPKRPNGLQGWVPADHVRIVRRNTRIEINRSNATLVLYRGTRRIFSVRVVVGRPGTETPPGLHAVAEDINTNSPGSFLGPRVLALTAHSDTIEYFRGGNGRVAIHGTNQPSLLGSRASLGCVRVDNATILKLSRLAPPGTPVRIK